MMFAYALLIVGLILIFLEFFLPGGIIGGIGALLLLLSIVFFSLSIQSPLIIILYILGVLLLVGVVIKFTLWRIKKTGRKKSIFLDSDQEGFVASGFEKEYIGKIGIAATDLKPAGHVLIEKKRMQALSKTGYLTKGAKVEVVGGEGAHLIVKEL